MKGNDGGKQPWAVWTRHGLVRPKFCHGQRNLNDKGKFNPIEVGIGKTAHVGFFPR
jgi:hypothetical protein